MTEKADQAVAILQALGFPKAQQNQRSALTLLALLELRPGDAWGSGGAPLMGVTQIMNFIADAYGKKYAPNTRETVRRQSIHQFVAAGLVVQNPDDPGRPINSGKTVYQIERGALELLRQRKTSAWEASLATYLASRESLRQRYAQLRQMNRIPLRLVGGVEITLSPGGQNELVKEVIENFCPRFTPGGSAVYVGDADEKWRTSTNSYSGNWGSS